MIRSYRIIVKGKVQGGATAHNAQAQAKLNLTGLIKNMPDGSVFINTEGEDNGKRVYWMVLPGRAGPR